MNIHDTLQDEYSDNIRMLMRIRDLPCGPRPQALQSIVDAATRGHADWNGLMVELPDVAMASSLAEVCVGSLAPDCLLRAPASHSWIPYLKRRSSA